MELNREQIIKALECCTSHEKCSECPCTDFCQGPSWLDENAFALINSQEQTIKELTEEIDSLKQCMEHEHASFMETFGEYGEKCERLAEENERLKAEKIAALDMFAEKLKRYYNELNGRTPAVLVAYHIDQIKQEMLRSDSDANT
jgi:hypothetical protein